MERPAAGRLREVERTIDRIASLPAFSTLVRLMTLYCEENDLLAPPLTSDGRLDTSRDADGIGWLLDTGFLAYYDSNPSAAFILDALCKLEAEVEGWPPVDFVPSA